MSGGASVSAFLAPRIAAVAPSICDVAVTYNQEYILHEGEGPVFRVGAGLGLMPAGGRIEFETDDGSAVKLTAHVGADRVLVMPGESKLGVTVGVDGMHVEEMDA